jgi:hypothetical protein
MNEETKFLTHPAINQVWFAIALFGDKTNPAPKLSNRLNGKSEWKFDEIQRLKQLKQAFINEIST